MTKLPPNEPRTVVHGDHSEIHPPDTLRAKALTKVRGNPLEIVEMITRADKALAALSSNFAEWMLNEVRRLTEAFAQFDAGPKDDAAYKALFVVAHDVRGQALQFGYPLAGQIAAGLCDLIQNRATNPVPAMILGRYVDSIASIVRAGVKDEANAVAVELARELNRLVTENRKRNAAQAAS
jgi:chemotaxis protein histidine kinase CheA